MVYDFSTSSETYSDQRYMTTTITDGTHCVSGQFMYSNGEWVCEDHFGTKTILREDSTGGWSISYSTDKEENKMELKDISKKERKEAVKQYEEAQRQKRIEFAEKEYKRLMERKAQEEDRIKEAKEEIKEINKELKEFE